MGENNSELTPAPEENCDSKQEERMAEEYWLSEAAETNECNQGGHFKAAEIRKAYLSGLRAEKASKARNAWEIGVKYAIWDAGLVGEIGAERGPVMLKIFELIEAAYAEGKAQSGKCERCGDLFYHPKTLIEDQKQRAAEWEDIAKKAQSELKQSAERVRELEERIREFKEYTPLPALEKIKSSKAESTTFRKLCERMAEDRDRLKKQLEDERRIDNTNHANWRKNVNELTAERDTLQHQRDVTKEANEGFAKQCTALKAERDRLAALVERAVELDKALDDVLERVSIARSALCEDAFENADHATSILSGVMIIGRKALRPSRTSLDELRGEKG